MKIMGDNALPVSEFGQSIVNQIPRWYYQIVGYPDIVFVCQEYSYPEWANRRGIMLINAHQVSGEIICAKFAKAPSRWQKMTAPDLVQITLKVDKEPIFQPDKNHRLVHFSTALFEMMGPLSITLEGESDDQ